MKDINIKGIIFGIIAILILDTLYAIVLMVIFLENTSPEAIEALNNETLPQVFSLFFGTLSTIVGGYVAAKYGHIAPYKNSFIIGLLGFIFGLLVMKNYTTWFNIIGFTTIIPSALFGGYFVARKKA